MITLRSGRATCSIDEACGARIASLSIDGQPKLVEFDDDNLGWGCYPMVPFAGRVRSGRLEFAGRVFELPLRLPPHAIHGTVCEKKWDVIDATDHRCTLATELQPGWPFAGRVEHHVDLSDDRLVMRLVVFAREPMPVQIGWHPWFLEPSGRRLGFESMHPRDTDGIASALPEPAVIGPVGTNDDCFADPDGILKLVVGDHTLELTSSCRYWVLYDEPAHATCLEPQSGPPNGVNDEPSVVASGEEFGGVFTIAWGSAAF